MSTPKADKILIRKAILQEAKAIKALIEPYAAEKIMLGRPLAEIYATIRDFWVAEDNDKIVGCVALHPYWEDLAEIRSLAVPKNYQHRGLGQRLVEKAREEARELKIRKVFALTYIPEFFRKLGFHPIDKTELPHKIWVDCINCPRFPDCDESALIYELEQQV